MSCLLKASLALLLSYHAALAQPKSEGLNNLIGLRIWIDNQLWDDKASFTAHRLGLEGTVNNDRSFYRGTTTRGMKSLGADLYALDLYAEQGYVQRVVLGFINKADLASAYRTAKISDFDKDAELDFLKIKATLSARLGPSKILENYEVWTWIGHDFILSKGREALTLTIQKNNQAVVTAPNQPIMESSQARNPPSHYLKRTGSGDIYIDALPPISQGNRNYCVPASWEKLLRHFGLGVNVYELAQKGGTQIQGTMYMPFAKQMEHFLSPANYKVQYLPNDETELEAIQRSINQGLPVIWALNANLLPYWIERTSKRGNQLPTSSIISTQSLSPAYHALLIIGYNKSYREIALSDSTELGSSALQIWITEAEMMDASVKSTPKIVVIPPSSIGVTSPGFIKSRSY